ncbi:MAG: type II secretion system F family protein [Chlamydiota bacterium]
MTIYSYEGFNSNQKKQKGSIQASSEHEARENLRQRGIIITKVRSHSRAQQAASLKGDELLNFTLQLSQLVGAGIPLYDSLATLEEQYRGEKCHQVILNLGEQIKEGSSLSEAMKQYPRTFEDLYRAMVAAGESSGALDVMLARLTTLLSNQNKLKKNIITAMIYPALLGCFTLAVIFLLLVFVVPSIEEIFEDRRVNGFTQAVLAVSHFLSHYWIVYLPAATAAILGALWKLKTPAGQRWKDEQLLQWPLFKTLTVQAAMARFTRTMSTLQHGGVNIIESLHLARKVMKNAVLEDIIAQAENRIIEGSTLGIELQKSPLIPKMVSRMIRVGEDTGDVAGMYNQIADIYEGEVEKTIARLTALAQPVILVTLGLIVGLVLLAVLLPFTDISGLSTG